MDFGSALTLLKVGEKLTRRGWNGNDMWIAYSPGFSLTSDRIFSESIGDFVEASKMPGIFRPYIMMKTVDDEFVPWVASQTDILAMDWQIV